ncbi:Nonsense-mediated mRNA decay factor SMG9 [Pseudolycoriella hygida]|uniref:Nonsense-mediated mRNA decay factor SMG9 n=1 Tax=Pseudolycoriella hygida TaxID=35572 RepID=A0A9Q0MQ97_9DIPT|nr:Nonsense-mediated mRNA decay factor SMG9 [Pseudolycoriella hygida]
MSEKRSKKYNNLKESKKAIVLAKKEEKDDEQSAGDHSHKSDQPKLLTKPKTCETQSVPITIAAREGIDTSNLQSSPTQKSVAITKEIFGPSVVEHATQKTLNLLQPIDIVTNHYHLNSTALTYLSESNDNFFVVGIIGCQGTGKSTFLNLLSSKVKEVDPSTFYFKEKKGTFRTQQTDQSFSAGPTTEGIQMFITCNRTILLDCSPVLCNPYLKKDSVQNEIDDLKMLIFLISVCHLLVVVQDELVNINLLRLLQCAEMMKPNLDKETTEEHYPHVMFVKNMSDLRNFSLDAKSQVDEMYKRFFQLSKLKIYPGVLAEGQDKCAKSVNYFVFPKVDFKRKKMCFGGYNDTNTLIEEFRRRVFMSPKKPMQILPQQGIFTEKSWSTLVTNVWESHKNNYFLRKYETFKEKEWSTTR